jgi:hypothetical protein
MIYNQFKQEEGSTLLLVLILMTVAITLITTMNNIIYSSVNQVKREEKIEKAKLLAEGGLEVALINYKNGIIIDEPQSLGEGKYRIDEARMIDGYLVIKSTGIIDNITRSVRIKKKLNIYFDGQNDYKTIPYRSDFDISDSITIEAWIKIDENANLPITIVSRKDIFKVYIDKNSKLAIDIYTKNNGGVQTVRTSKLDLSEWTHIAFVYDSQAESRNGKYQIYINTIKEKSASNLHNFLPTPENELVIGADSNYNEKWHGYIKDLRIWNKARTQGEIADNKDKHLTTSEPWLVFIYP